ncbi:alpha/beta hydrolase family protein [Streptomyces sodiiphilus]|uniref:Alpha/beta hydrolase family protein n=1 Tax=Streptomyces sodiiphilus TaxID=226217 RepID=A0ABN2NT29_9ACTN
MLLPLAVVIAVLATSGWVGRGDVPEPGVYAAELRDWQRGAVAGQPLPGPSSPPREVARFFSGLSRPQQQRLAERYPLVVGNLAGAPVTLRYRANRLALAEAREAERERMTDERLTPAGQYEAGRRMNRFTSLLRSGRQILAFDPTGRGRAAEVFGDLDHAERISVVVPGVDTELLTFERTRLKYRAPVGMAQALYRTQRKADPGLRTAVIAWADYTAPQGLGMSAATGELAAEGARRLAGTVHALPGEVPVALFCHSYGSVVCGLAAAELPDHVTDIAVAGSPGMRASSADRLGTSARVWAVRARDDWISGVPHLALGPIGHGTDPVTPEFGARRLSAGTSRGHAGYFEPGASSLTSFAQIGTGAIGAIRCTAGARV